MFVTLLYYSVPATPTNSNLPYLSVVLSAIFHSNWVTSILFQFGDEDITLRKLIEILQDVEVARAESKLHAEVMRYAGKDKTEEELMALLDNEADDNFGRSDIKQKF